MQCFTRFHLTPILIATLVSQVISADFGPRNWDVANGWTAIVAAYAPEIEAIDAMFEAHPEAEITETVYYRGVRYQLGTFSNEPVVVFTTGISVSNAAMTMQMALDYFPIDRVIMMGIAGGVNPVFEPADISVPERWYFHDESVYANPDPENKGSYILPDYYESSMEQFQARRAVDPHAPDYKNIGYIFPEEVSVIKDGWEKPQSMPYFTVTPELFQVAQSVVEKAEQTIEMPSGKRAIHIRVGGNGVTGSVFLDNAEHRLWLRDVYQAEVTEMESAAVGQVCFVNSVDWLIIRSVSDLAGGQSGKNVENVFDAIASGTGATFLELLLEQIKDLP
jgi:adenosylhomocysteine nucleosidase